MIIKSKIQKYAVYLSAIVTFGVLIFLIGYILVNGIPHLKLSLFSIKYTTENVSMFPSIVNTVIIRLL